MDVIILFNGLGNQMSQYAFFISKKNINKSTYFITFCKHRNGLEINKVFNIDCKETLLQNALYLIFRILLTDKLQIIFRPLKHLLRFFQCKIIKEDFNYNYNKDYLLNSSGITFYFGGWHTEKYMLNVKDGIYNEYTFRKVLDSENIYHEKTILSVNSVAIHVRRGDYLNSDNYDLFGDICTKGYFDKAIKLICSMVYNPHFFVFSDDINWVKSHLNISNVTYITSNINSDSWKDMYLMSICKHNIISNSTFSWWGAWLNKNPDKIVISPTQFIKNKMFPDVYPESWIKLSDY